MARTGTVAVAVASLAALAGCGSSGGKTASEGGSLGAPTGDVLA